MENILSNQELSDKVGRTVSFMQYQAMQDYDYYYPSIEELNNLGTVDANGNIQYDEYELAFLVWVTRPADPEHVSEEQKAIMAYAIQLRMEFEAGFTESDQEYDAKKALLAQYAAKAGQRKG
ncbi:hypothetical protein [Butyrivibrio sp.]|uniref:hypothetical protein n=1 Tax=Butyrivibrio sp. TaxID=28121 RepID=UPI0025C3B30A|nr:hypothetical protein [Butyrivibrio sp.]MBQ7430233.1 hypothetical protein [Butyrivibrio sp.]MBQ9303407.1 hypothetical protein [Butyrivibrio sp.]